MNVGILPAALAEAAEAKYWYVDRDRGSPETFQRSLDSALELLELFPDLGKPYAYRTRRLQLEVVPYAIVYRRQPDSILIVAVAHNKQSPRSWRGRLG